MIGKRGERGSGISVLAARHDDDDDDDDDDDISKEKNEAVKLFDGIVFILVWIVSLLWFVDKVPKDEALQRKWYHQV